MAIVIDGVGAMTSGRRSLRIFCVRGTRVARNDFYTIAQLALGPLVFAPA